MFQLEKPKTIDPAEIAPPDADIANEGCRELTDLDLMYKLKTQLSKTFSNRDIRQRLKRKVIERELDGHIRRLELSTETITL